MEFVVDLSNSTWEMFVLLIGDCLLVFIFGVLSSCFAM